MKERGQYLYVTSGIGTSGVPVRWGVPPEFAVLDLIGIALAPPNSMSACRAKANIDVAVY